MKTIFRNMSSQTKALLVTAAMVGSNHALADSIKVTVEGAGATNTSTTFTATGIQNFDQVADGWYEEGNTIDMNFPSFPSELNGTIQNVFIRDANEYGGAGGVGNYAITPCSNRNYTTRISLDQNLNYFGLWISAMNDDNTVSIYRDSELLYQLDMTALSKIIGSCSSNPGSGYCGNPEDQAQAPTEPFAFVNFYSKNGEGFNVIVLSGAGFDSDNWTFGNFLRASGVPVIFANDTYHSLRPNALALRNVYNQQSAKIAQGLSYDCTTFDTNGVCVSFAGSRSDTKGQFDAAISNTLIAAYKPSQTLRFGGYVDQSSGNSTSGGLTIHKGKPGWGLFGAWTQNVDGSGVQVRAAANMGQLDIETQREAIGTAEAGYGESDVKSRGFLLEMSKHYALNSTFSARPYIGYRQTTNTRSAYTEASSDDVMAPLTYTKLKQKTDTVLAGVTLGVAFNSQTNLMLNAGVESDQRKRIDGYQGSSSAIPGIEAIDMNTNKRQSRPTVSLALSHNMGKAQNMAVRVTHRKEAFDDVSTTSALVQYSQGF